MDAMKEQIGAAVQALLEDYRMDRQIDQIDGLCRPDRDAVIDIVKKLRRLVFPGYFRERNYRSYHAENHLSALMEDVIYHLSTQITRALQGCDQEQMRLRAMEITLDFFGQLPRVRGLLQTDMEAALDGDPAASCCEEVVLSYPGLFAIMVYRIAHELYVRDVPMIPRMMTEYAHGLTGIDIHPGAVIGSHFFIDHGTGVVIGETTVIGNRVKMYQGATLGALSPRAGHDSVTGQRHPTVGDNVTIYAGATILGGETVIGANTVIGGNTFITDSVKDATRVTIKAPELKFRQAHKEGETK